MMRIVSGYFQMNAEWEATLPPKHKEAVLLRREERPRKSAEMMAILDALAGDPLFELQMFGDVYELLTKHGEAAKKRGTVRTGSAYRTHLNPAARSDDIADVVSGIPGRTGAASE